MYILGNATLYLGLAVALYTAVASTVGIVSQKPKWGESARGGVLALMFLSTLSSFLLLYLLGTGRFEFKYVAAYTNETLPIAYKLSAFWAGNAGSLLLWAFLLCMYMFVIVYSKKTTYYRLIPCVIAILSVNILFFYTVMVFNVNPFAMTDTIPPDGKGLNPMLQNPGMVIHPVTLYLGYVGMAIPFAFAIGALLLKDMDATWIRLTRRWTLSAWLFLTLGNITGGWWAYVELGWGGYWAWDPVENASFMPWLTATALLHSVIIQERKGMLKTWNLILVIVTYLLSLFGTFLVRSGLLTSVHAFSDSDLGRYFLVFMTLMAIISCYVMISRYQLIQKNTRPLEAYISKETNFLINNLILVVLAFAVMWGTMYPLISEAFFSTKVNVGPPFFKKVTAPIFLLLLFLVAICPPTSWTRATFSNLLRSLILPVVVSVVGIGILIALDVNGAYSLLGFFAVFMLLATHIHEIFRSVNARMKTTGESLTKSFGRLVYKNRRRYGGYIVHMGIGFMAIGIISTQSYSIEKTVAISANESTTIGDYKLTFKKLEEDMDYFNKTNNGKVYAQVAIEKNGKEVGEIRPEKIFYSTWPEPTSEVKLYTTWKEYLYVVLSSWEDDKKATFLIKVNPFVNWIWGGGIIVLLGTLYAMSVDMSKPRIRQKKLGIKS